jgi:hypothetical protein
MNFDFGIVEITAGTYRVIYSLYDRRLLSLIYGRCVYKMNVILHERTHAAVVYTLTLFDTVTTTQNTWLGRQAATDCQREREETALVLCCAREGGGL